MRIKVFGTVKDMLILENVLEDFLKRNISTNTFGRSPKRYSLRSTYRRGFRLVISSIVVGRQSPSG